MRALILSDIHGNLEALEAVLAAADGLWDELWNLGDMVGYGGSPNQVIDRLRPLAAVHVRGNHDRVCCGLTSTNAFNPVARTAALWTRGELTPENAAWLAAMPQGPIVAAEGVASCAHGSPMNEDEYLLTMRDAWTPLEQMSTPITFFGHTHVQGGFERNGNAWHEIRPAFSPVGNGNGNGNGNGQGRGRLVTETQSVRQEFDRASRVLINPGSVGQPRDFDWRAAFAVFDSERNAVTFFRVPYDLVASQGRILLANLPERLATRLREGR